MFCSIWLRGKLLLRFKLLLKIPNPKLSNDLQIHTQGVWPTNLADQLECFFGASRDLVRKGHSVPLACIQQLSNDFGAIVFAGQLCGLATNILRVLQSCLRLAKTRSVRLTPSAAKYCSSQSLASQSEKLVRIMRTLENDSNDLCGKNEMPTLLAVAIVIQVALRNKTIPCSLHLEMYLKS